MSRRLFRAETAQDAFEQVRARLGPAAVILSVTRRAGGVEVVATADRSGRPGGPTHAATGAAPARRRAATAPMPRAAARTGTLTVRPEDAGDAAEPGAEPSRTLHSRSIRRRPSPSEPEPSGPPLRLVPGGSTPTAFTARMRAIELPDDVARRLGRAVAGEPDPWAALPGALDAQYPIPELPAPPPGRPLVLAFVGPRWVGRSTLARGLAASAAVALPDPVAWIETGFPGRRLQARHDLDIPLGVDRRTADSPRELASALRDHAHAGLLIVDLPGIDCHDPRERAALARYVGLVRRGHPQAVVHAVLPAMWSAREAGRILKSLEVLELSGVAWTSFDRAGDPGTVLAAAFRVGRSPSFLLAGSGGDDADARVASWKDVVERLRQVTEDDG